MVIRRALIALLCLMLGWGMAAAQANPVEFLTPVTGVVESGGEQDWSFPGTGGSVISILVESSGGTLDPAVALLNSQGDEVIRNDDFSYPTNTDALLQAITLPQNDTYTVRVTGINGTSGDYSLTVTPGYAEIAAVESFSGEVGWDATGGQLSQAEGALTLNAQGALRTAIAAPSTPINVSDFFAEAHLNVTGSEGWIVGLTARQRGDERYRLKINHRGEWRLEIQSGEEERILRDWTPHPALGSGRESFRLALLANGSSMDFFLDGQLFGRFNDDTLNDGRGVGLLVETLDSLSSRVSASLDELVITQPRTAGGQPILPQRYIVAAPADIVRDFQRQAIIPAGGELALNVTESFVESRLPGVEAFLLARETTFTDLVMGVTLTIQAADPGMVGCGLIFGGNGDDTYWLAYVDAAGGRGLSQRDGDTFQAGLFVEGVPEASTTHDLLVIAQGGRILYYVNQQLVGRLDEASAVGAIGNAVVNFEPIATSCQFSNTWVWRWDSAP